VQVSRAASIRLRYCKPGPGRRARESARRAERRFPTRPDPDADIPTCRGGEHTQHILGLHAGVQRPGSSVQVYVPWFVAHVRVQDVPPQATFSPQARFLENPRRCDVLDVAHGRNTGNRYLVQRHLRDGLDNLSHIPLAPGRLTQNIAQFSPVTVYTQLDHPDDVVFVEAGNDPWTALWGAPGLDALGYELPACPPTAGAGASSGSGLRRHPSPSR
jgi:hypothetical protein